MNLLHHTAEFDRVLKLFVNAGVEAAICGGAPRDALLGRQRKDIDVFVLARDRRKVCDMHQLLVGFTNLEARDSTESGGYEGLDVDATYDFPNGVNVIVMADRFNSWDACIERNDFGLCQVGYTTYRRFFWTPAFEHDAKNQCFTLLRYDRRERSLERYQRLSAEKYWDWKLVDILPAEDAAEGALS